MVVRLLMNWPRGHSRVFGAWNPIDLIETTAGTQFDLGGVEPWVRASGWFIETYREAAGLGGGGWRGPWGSVGAGFGLSQA